MPFTKTEVDVHTDYVVEAVDPAWLQQGVKSPKHLMLDPDNCIVCRACEDVCPWNCIFMLSTGIVDEAADDSVEAEVGTALAVFVVDDNA
jgi:NAD-dependent dihydropyrimidine dehydrogenase PreA subunit